MSRRNKLYFRSQSSKSFNTFNIFDQYQIQEFKEAFNLIDQDKDGLISFEDLKLMFSSLGKPVDHDDINIINEMLAECSGPLNFTMFLSLFAEKIGLTDPESVVLSAFSIFDPENNGNVNCIQLRNLITTNGDRFTQEEIDDFLMNSPLTLNGTNLNYREFSKFLNHVDT
ncbi:unnamed protein product [Brachionus calyciflorus]|uniref:EF-hand domain-containing protein n=1 Tax=Brachionus calyciflorus TaxID=104777 RepID=A0A814GDU9_9BILA|nr:unnamed protein product [Brachionus calyciflorus]